MKLPENLVTYILREAERIHHGRIIIEINASSQKTDVITETRERFLRGMQGEQSSEFFNREEAEMAANDPRR